MTEITSLGGGKVGTASLRRIHSVRDFNQCFSPSADQLEPGVSVNNLIVYLLQKTHSALARATPASPACPSSAASPD